MVTPVLRELAGPYPLLPFVQEPWFLHEPIARHLITAWEHTCWRVARDGSAADLHAVRDDYLAVLVGYIRILEGYLVLRTRFGGEAAYGDGLAQLAACRDHLQRHFDSLFPRWQTLGDLQELIRERTTIPEAVPDAVPASIY